MTEQLDSRFTNDFTVFPTWIVGSFSPRHTKNRYKVVCGFTLRRKVTSDGDFEVFAFTFLLYQRFMDVSRKLDIKSLSTL